MVIKAQTEEAAEWKLGYQSYEDWIDLKIYKNPMEMDVRLWNASLQMRDEMQEKR